MNTYNPDKWKIVGNGEVFKVLGGWSGGYLDSDNWRLSSGIVEIKENNLHWVVTNASGSTYECHKNAEGLTLSSANIYNQLLEKGFSSYTMEEVVKIKGEKEDVNNT